MGASILVIDDEESIRYTFEKFLTFAGHIVTTAENCREALEKIDKGGIDLVLSDIVLPDGNGMDILREIKLREPACPVVIITAYPTIETALESLRMGAFDYIQKPILQHDVMQTVNMALQQKQDGKSLKRNRRRGA